MKPICFLLLLFISGACARKHESADHAHDHGDGTHTHSHEPAVPAGEVLDKKTIPATEISPEYIQLANHVEIIPDIREAVKSVGVLTHEGIFGPLLFAEKTRAFFIELKPGMFLGEHPHPTESIVYTVSGTWVLCSEGKREVMEAGSVFHFGSNMPTGWEAPFAEGALLFVVKSKEADANYEPFMKGLNEMKATLDKERANGTPFYYKELKPDHPAILFARSVNPNFDEVLKNSSN